MDTRSKRASSVQILVHSTLAPPLPDGTISQGDRQHIPHSYSGILASSPPGGGGIGVIFHSAIFETPIFGGVIVK